MPGESSSRAGRSEGQPVGSENLLLDLSLRHDITAQDIAALYRRLAQRMHPDHGGDVVAFRRLQREYEAAISRLATRRSSANFVLPGHPGPASRRPSSRVVTVGVVLTVAFLAFVRYWLGPWESAAILGMGVGFLILAGIPVLLAACRPGLAAVLMVVITLMATAVLGCVIASGALREAIHPIGAEKANTFQHLMTWLVTGFATLALMAGILGFLFSASDHEI